MLQYKKFEYKFIKSSAIIMMLYHHMFGFVSWILKSNMYFRYKIGNHTLQVILARYCKLCVGLFAFQTGYAMYLKSDEYSSYKSVIKKIMNFLIRYWIVFLIFIIVGILIKEPLPTLKLLIEQLF